MRAAEGASLSFTAVLQRIHNGKYNAFDIIHYIVIPKANYLVALRFKIPGSLHIVFFLLQMLRPKEVPSSSITSFALGEQKSGI